MSGRERWADERGGAGGFEALPLGFLVFVVGTLLLVNAWGVIDAKMAVSAAAREAARAYVEAPSAEAAGAVAVAAAHEALAAHGRDPQRMQLVSSGGFGRCSRVTWTAIYEVPPILLPWVGGLGRGIAARASHSEIVDPLRRGLPGEAGCVAG